MKRPKCYAPYAQFIYTRTAQKSRCVTNSQR